MNCERAQEYIALDAYDELTDEQAHALGQHLESCPTCQQELESMHRLVHHLSLETREEPSANLIAGSRVRLDEALDNLPAATMVSRMQGWLRGTMTQLRMMPAAAAVLVCAGAGLGAAAMHGFAARGASAEGTVIATPLPAEAMAKTAPGEVDGTSIANIRNVVASPGTNNVSIEYNRIVPEHLEGTLDDPVIRRLVVAAAQNGDDSVVQDKSVRLLADESRSQPHCVDEPVRTALVNTLLRDKDAGVRAEALQGLEPCVGQVLSVRDAVLDSMMHDPSAVVRTEAIRLIHPVQGDSSVRLVLHRMASRETNPSVRTASRQVLNEVPDVQ